MVRYKKGKPTEDGVYACRIPISQSSFLCEDIFLTWYYGRWNYLGSDQRYRGTVVGWIGPLERLNFLQ